MTVEIAGEDYVLDIEAARKAGVLVREHRYHEGQYFKYASNFLILIKDQRLNFNLFNLTCGCWLSQRWYVGDKTYLTDNDMSKFMGVGEYALCKPMNAVKFELK